jgi:hypothetical protein
LATALTGGLVWACADGDYDDSQYSNFSPEAFVDPQYSPFFYASSVSYYGNVNDDSNTRYNELVVKEWETHLKGKVSSKDLEVLLFKASDKGLDSVYKYSKGKLAVGPAGLPDVKSFRLSSKELDTFLSYLLLAKSCESFAVQKRTYYWDEKKPAPTGGPTELGERLLQEYQSTKDIFMKQRFWFQLVRYYYFQELAAAGPEQQGNGRLVSFFEQSRNLFPKNLMYYRALSYLGGHYYQQKDYATANYLYSLSYDFSADMKIPSKWSFHPQNESDWEKSLKLAKNNEEKITLWHMLGISNDPERAIDKIYALNPKSEKLDLLLSRLINGSEDPGDRYFTDTSSFAATERKRMDHNAELVGRIARNNNTAKPYFWNLGAGYLNTLSGHYALARTFYNKAKTQLPKNDKLLSAQYKILDWTLFLSQLKKIDAQTEKEMVGPINWLADLRDGKDTISNLRFNRAVAKSVETLSALYKKQGNLLKSNCFSSNTAFYTTNQNVEALKALLSKPGKTAFELAMLRYYPLKMEDLYYHQALMLVYKEKIDEAVPLMEKAGQKATFNLLGNPFTIHIYDCHDCDFVAPQKKKYTPLTFLKTMQSIKAEIAAGKNVFNNAYLLANAYYNITHYGNARLFYQNEITGTDATQPTDIPKEFRLTFTSGKLAEKYYLLARANASTKDQKARCTYMASKCERNEIYNSIYFSKANEKKYYWEEFSMIPSGKYFAELKRDYSQTQYYKEVLNECGYFRKYAGK